MKQNVMKRTLAGVLAVLTVAAYMPANVGGFLTESTGIVMGVSAEGATSVSTADDLENAVKAGGAVQLTANIDLTKTLNVTEDVTIDLNGYNITADGFRAFHVQSGTLTLSGNGTVSSTGSKLSADSSVIRVGDGFDAADGTGTTPAALTVGKDVTISTDKCYGISVFGRKTAETLNVYGNVNVTSDRNAISGNGTSGLGSTEINIYEGASVTSTGDVAIYHPQAGALNITGGTIEGVGGIEAKGGAIDISGDAVITATGTVGHVANNNGTSTDGYAIAAVRNSSYAGNNTFEISGGTFSGKIGVVVDDNNTSANYDPEIHITGGKFTDDVSAYVAEGYAQNPDGTVVTLDNYIWQLSESKTYTLEDDMELKYLYVPANVTATLDLKGHKIISSNNEGYSTVYIFGNLTITDSRGDGVIESSNSSGIVVGKNGTLTFEEGKVEAQEVAVLFPYTGAKVTINGGSFITTDNFVLGGNGTKRTTDTTPNELTVNGGTFYGKISSTGYVACGIYCPNDDIITLNGGSFTAYNGAGIVARAGKITINDGASFTTTGTATGKVGDSRVVVPCAPLVFDTEANYPGLKADSQITVNGGSFWSEDYADNIAAIGDKSRIKLAGGTYNSDIDPEFIADGYYLIDNAPNYTVKKDERVDLSKAKIVVNDGKAYSSSNPPSDIRSDIKVTIGDVELVAGEDYEIYEGDTSAYDIGTYVFKIRGLGNYKGTATANWTITNSLEITVYGYNSDTSAYFKPCQYGKSVTVTPPEGFVWDETCYWEVEKDVNQWEIVSYSQNYSFIALKNATLRINKSAEEVSEKSALTMSTSKTKYNNKNAIKFTFNRSIDEKYTAKEVGILYATNKLAGADTTKANYKTANLSESGTAYGVENLEESLKTLSTVKKFVANVKKSNGTVEFSYALSADNIYANAIGYVTVYDPSTKETKTLYTNVAATDYNNA